MADWATCPLSAWAASRDGQPDSSVAAPHAPRSGTAPSWSWAPCTATTSSPRCPAVQRDSKWVTSCKKSSSLYLHFSISVQLLWPPGDPSRPEDQLLLRLQSDRVLPPVRCPGLPLRQASQAQLPDQGGCQQSHDPRRHWGHWTDQPALLGKNHS